DVSAPRLDFDDFRRNPGLVEIALQKLRAPGLVSRRVDRVDLDEPAEDFHDFLVCRIKVGRRCAENCDRDETKKRCDQTLHAPNCLEFECSLQFLTTRRWHVSEHLHSRTMRRISPLSDTSTVAIPPGVLGNRHTFMTQR